MRIEAILRSKGSEVETVRPDAAVTMAAQRMAALRIGCLVVARRLARPSSGCSPNATWCARSRITAPMPRRSPCATS